MKKNDTPEWRIIESYATRKGIRPMELQKRCGITRTQFYDKRRGRKGWYIDEIARIAKICGITDADILAIVKGGES